MPDLQGAIKSEDDSAGLYLHLQQLTSTFFPDSKLQKTLPRSPGSARNGHQPYLLVSVVGANTA